MAKALVEDLGYIKVRTVGWVDTIYLGFNDERIATVSCQTGKPATVKIAPGFLKATTFKWKQVFEVYTAWKRATCPNLKIPEFADLSRPQGHVTKTGEEHPWRKKRKQQPIAAQPIVKPNEPAAQQ